MIDNLFAAVNRALAFGRSGIAAVLACGLWVLAPAVAQDCTAAAPVCSARGAVFHVSAFDPVGSAVRIGDRLLVTNRHIVADRETAEVFRDGQFLGTADVVPSSYAGDLILLHFDGLPDSPELAFETPGPDATVFGVGMDIGSMNVRVFPAGAVAALPAPDHPLARLHHGAYGQPGMSGGALVDENGKLVGIIASGGEGQNEAIPVSEIEALRESSGPTHAAAHDQIAVAYRTCFELLDPRVGRPSPIDDETANRIAGSCRDSGNRQYFDLAGRVLGESQRLEQSIAMYQLAVAQDPNAVNARLGLVVSLHFAGRFAEAAPHARHLIESLPDDPQVLRYAIQAGKWGGDPDLAEQGYALLESQYPDLAPAARRFLDSDIPAPAPPGGTP